MRTSRLVAIALLAGCGVGHDRPAAAPAVGSERGSAIAIPGASERHLVYLAGRTSEDELAALARAAPNVRVIAGLSPQSALEHAAIANGADAELLSDELLAKAPELRWVQASSAGVDRYLGFTRLIEDDAVVFTNMKGVHGPAIAEHAFAMLLSLTRKLRVFDERAAAGRWSRGGVEGMTALAGRTMLVVGLGGIGSEVARRAKGFDMTVLATVRTRREAPAFVDRLGSGGELDSLLPEADVVVICTPLTPETEGLFDAARLARGKRGAILVNIARGRIVDTAAMVAALDSGQLGGACLDVTEPEPLPAGHALWGRANVVITPHVAAVAEITGERAREVLVENFRRFAHGEPLLNVVDKRAGY